MVGINQTSFFLNILFPTLFYLMSLLTLDTLLILIDYILLLNYQV